MREPNWESCSEEDLWKYVGYHLAKNGIETILVGGAVCAIYSEGIYKSGDLDFVIKSGIESRASETLLSLGFTRQSSRHYIRPGCEKFVEFVVGPAGIGDDIKIKPNVVEVEGFKLYIYSPTDCIRDRLASFIHFKARECFDQAVLVASRHPFKQENVREWCKSEGSPETYDKLIGELKRLKTSRV